MDVAPPEWLDAELWQTWIDYRREDKKKPASDRSLRMTITKLERLRGNGYDPHLLIETAIEREWQGIYAHDDCKRHNDSNACAVERFRDANRPRPRLRSVGASG